MRALVVRSTASGGLVAGISALTQMRFQGSSSHSEPASEAAMSADPATSHSSPSGSASPIQQLYKSSHKGSGNVPMPKPLKPKKLKSHTIPTISDAEAAILSSRSSCAEDQGPVPQRSLSPLQRRQLLFKNKAAFILTPQALRRVKYLLSQYAANHPVDNGASLPVGIHIGVRRRGCSGYSYTVNYHFPSTTTATTSQPGHGSTAPTKKGGMDDVVVEQDGVKVVVDGDALFYVIGTEMDYVVRNVEEKFTFKNPNQKYSCGCEESFMPFDEDDLDE